MKYIKLFEHTNAKIRAGHADITDEYPMEQEIRDIFQEIVDEFGIEDVSESKSMDFGNGTYYQLKKLDSSLITGEPCKFFLYIFKIGSMFSDKFEKISESLQNELIPRLNTEGYKAVLAYTSSTLPGMGGSTDWLCDRHIGKYDDPWPKYFQTLPPSDKDIIIEISS